jgi:hypothetical protein
MFSSFPVFIYGLQALIPCSDLLLIQHHFLFVKLIFEYGRVCTDLIRYFLAVTGTPKVVKAEPEKFRALFRFSAVLMSLLCCQRRPAIGLSDRITIARVIVRDAYSIFKKPL